MPFDHLAGSRPASTDRSGTAVRSPGVAAGILGDRASGAARTTLLGGTALAGALLAFQPVPARAQVTTDTTGTFGVVTNRNERVLAGDPGSNFAVLGGGATFTGFGKAYTILNGAPLTVSNVNATLTSAPGGANGGTAALRLFSSGGALSVTGGAYTVNNGGFGTPGLEMITSGFGTIDLGSAGTAVTPTFTGVPALNLSTVDGTQTVFLNAGTLTANAAGANGATLASSGAGTINATLTGATAITTTTAGGTGIAATASGAGAVTLSSDSTISTTGPRFATGIAASAAGGAGAVGVTFDGSLLVSGNGIAASTAGTGTVSVAGSGTVNTNSVTAGQGGIVATSTAGGATGAVTVNVSGPITGPSGIVASSAGTAAGSSVSVTTTGVVTGTFNTTGAFDAQTAGIRATAVAGNVTINSGALVTSPDDGIFAATSGGGNILITAGAITSDNNSGFLGRGINALATTAGNGTVTVNANGPISAAGYGIFALAVNGGTATATSSGNIAVRSSTQRVGVQAQSADGAATVNLRSGTITSLNNSAVSAAGASAVSTGAGAVTIDMTDGAGAAGGQIGTSAASRFAGDGADATASGTGNVTVTAGTMFVTGNGVDAVHSGTAAGEVAVDGIAGTGIDATGVGIFASNAGTGGISLGGGTAIGNVTAGGVGISASSTGGTNTTPPGLVSIATAAGTTVTGTTGITASSTFGSLALTLAGNVTGTAGFGVQTTVDQTLTNPAGRTATLGIGGAIQAANGFAGVSGNNLRVAMGSTGTVTNGGGAGTGADAIEFRNGALNALNFAGATSGLTGNVALTSAGTTLELNQNTGIDTTVANVFTGTTVTINKTGANAILLTGTNTAAANLTGTANVNGGTLAVNGVFGDAVSPVTAKQFTINVNSTGTLHGSGTVDGNVNVNSGGTISAGNSPGTLTIAGNLVLNAGSTSLFELGASGIRGGASNDLIEVSNNLTLGGTLALTDMGGAPLVTGAYRLFDYGGTVGGSFANITLAAGSTARVSTATPTQVNVFVNNGSQILQGWDGADQTGVPGGTAGAQGGNGTWNSTNTNWTYLPGGEINDSWQQQVGLFGGAAGTVTVVGPQNFQGLQFATTAYLITGDAINATGNPFASAGQDLSFLNVTATAATINSNVTSNAGFGIDKLGAGTLVLGGAANSYTGLTQVSSGTLEVSGTGRITASSGLNNLAGFQLDTGAQATFGIRNVINDATGNIGIFNGATMSGLVASNAGVIGNAGTWNNGTVQANTGRIVNAVGTWTGDFTNNGGGTIDLVSGTLAGAVTNQQGGAFVAYGGTIIGAVSNSGSITVNAATALTPDGSFGIAAGTPAFAALTGQLANTGTLTGLSPFTNTATGVLTVAAGATYTLPSVTNQAGGQASNAGAVNASLDNAGNTGNATGATWTGALTNTGTVGNAGTWNGNATNTGTLVNAGTWMGAIANNAGGRLVSVDAGTVMGALTNAQGATVDAFGGSFAGIGNAGAFNVPGPTALDAASFGAPASTALAGRLGNNGSVTGTGTFDNAGTGVVTIGSAGALTVVAMNNAGLINTAGTLAVSTPLVLNPDRTPASGGLRNSGTVNATAGAVNGGVVSTGAFNVTGTVTSNNSFVNQNGGTLSVTGQGTKYTIAGDLVNNAGATVTVGAGATLQDALFNSGLVTNDGLYIATVNNLLGGVITGSGTFQGDFNNNGTYRPVGTTAAVTGTFTNASVIDLTTGGTTTNVLTGGNYVGVAGSQAVVNVDLRAPAATATPGTANRINLTTATGNTTVSFVNLAGSPNAITFYPQIPVITTTNNNNTAFVADPASLAALQNGFISYVFNNGTLFGDINAAQATATAAQISAVLTTLNTDFFQDFQPFITAPQDPDPNSVAGGIWVRGKYGVDTFDHTAFSPLSSANSRIETEFAGFQVGADIGRFNIDKSGWNVIGGVTAGEVFSNSHEKLAGALRGNFEIPFVGAYGVVSNGGFRVAALYRHDFYGLRFNDPPNGLNDRRLNADGDSISLDSGYNIQLGNYGKLGNLFFDPSGSLILSKVTVDPLTFGPGLGTLRFNNIDSALGRAGFRFGSSLVEGEFALQPFVTASVWHEFAKNTTSTLSIGAFDVPLSVTRIGTFGQVGLGVNGELLGKNILGTVRADFRFGDKVDGQSVTAQLRYQF